MYYYSLEGIFLLVLMYMLIAYGGMFVHALTHAGSYPSGEGKGHDKLVQEMRGKYKGSQESWASRLNDTLKLKDNLERKVKDLECEVEKLQPVRSLAPCWCACSYVFVGFCGWPYY